MAGKKAILLRISPELWEQLNRWAAHELRSVNAQIEYVLREAVRRRAGDRPTEKSGEAPTGGRTVERGGPRAAEGEGM
jgi:hypothetical protein